MPGPLPTGFKFDPTLLRAGRKARGLSMHQVAARVGCSVALVNCAELGYRRPAPTTLAAMADAVGVSLDDLFVRDEPDARVTT